MTRIIPDSFRTLIVGITLLTSARTADASPILNQANGHYYDVINASVDWNQASAAATVQSFLGVAGHLVTITSAQENLFLTNTFGSDGLHFHWTGGFQPAGSPEPAGGWTWVTGESFVFSNWWPGGEPNNFGGDENRIAFDHGLTANGKAWNDLSGTQLIAGYVVEFDVPRVPEPSSLGIAIFGAIGLLGLGWHRRRTEEA